MAQKAKKQKSKFECDFCNRSFASERTLINHSCRIKERMMDKDLQRNRVGFNAFCMFYSLHMQSKKPKTYYDFAKSQFYLAFVKFGRYIIDNHIMYPEKFMEMLIRANVSVDKWTAPSNYELFLRDLTKRESPEDGTTRTILLMKQWAEETDNDYSDFFRKIEPTLAVHYIQRGRISPWILYNCDSGRELLHERFNQDQINLVAEWLDPDYWSKKFQVNKQDREELQELFRSYNL